MSIKGFYCSNCGEEIDSWKSSVCPYCNEPQSYEKRAAFLNHELLFEDCPKCGCDKSFYQSSSYFDIAICCNCGAETYFNDEDKEPMPRFVEKPKITCPYCNSTDTKKITNTSKVGRFALFGILSVGKLTKQWHCNNCKSDF